MAAPQILFGTCFLKIDKFMHSKVFRVIQVGKYSSQSRKLVATY